MDLFNSKYILSNKRFGWIDYDRGISIILVTYRHCYESIEKAGFNMHEHPILEYINVFFFGFRMPLFFIASGIFVSGSLRKRGLAPYQKNRVQTILYPMMIWGIIQITLQMLFSGYTNSDVTPISYLYLLIDPRSTGQFWYLNALFFVGIIYSFLKVKFNAKLWHQMVLGLVLYFFAAYISTTTHDIGFLKDICKYYLFFCIGDMVSEYMLSEKAARQFTSWKFVLPLFIGFMATQYFFTKINLAEGDNYYVENRMPFFFIIVALVGCAISMCASFSLKKYEGLKFLRVVGYNSVHIYCMQIISMSVARQFFFKILHINYLPLLVILVLSCGVVIPMLVYNICLRLNMWWMFTLKKPEEEIQYLQDQRMATSKAV
ncbi:MAG: acyltransferase [Bacteroidetes bacterium]|nr:acyltransferase [Bacteroidota bacterium]